MKQTFAVVAAAAVLGACSITPPSVVPEAAALPASWYAPPVAHQGQTRQLKAWWGRFNDPVLSDSIARAQAESSSVAAARAQVWAARAALAGAESRRGPQASLVASAARGQASSEAPLGNSLAAGVQASWALDVWGQEAARGASAQAQQDAANASWHEARVLVAAETAQAYFGYRHCLALLAVAQRDRDSRQATQRSLSTTERAGLTAPAVAALARASSAEGAVRAQQQAEQCDRQLKSLVALTATPEPELRARVATAPPTDPQGPPVWLAVDAVPAEVIRQRPDVYRAQRELVAAAEAVGVARAALLPSLTLEGSALRNRFSGGGASSTFNTWSVGPLTLSLPLLGRGALDAEADAAQARYHAAGKAYAASLRQAVAEVEQALVTLSGLQQRAADTDAALEGYTRSFQATEARHRVGLADLNELEDARRLRLSAEGTALALRQERIDAWIALYVALGGGFDSEHAPNALQDPA